MNNTWLVLRPLALLAGLILLILTASRLYLIAINWSRVAAVDGLGFIGLQGLRFDLVLVGMVLLVPCLVLPLLCTWDAGLRLWQGLMVLYLPLVLMSVTFLELATPSFAEQFDARPNRLFFEYLEHPAEILGTLLGAYRLPLLIGVPLVLLIGVALWRLIRYLQVPAQPITLWIALPVGVVLSLACGMAIRSTLDHRPVNPSSVALTTDSLVNELPLNSTYSVLYAGYEMRHEEDEGGAYASMDIATAARIVRDDMRISASDFLEPEGSTWHRASATRDYARPKNLVIILEESLGAEFVGSLGGLDLTPNLDALREQGLAFDRLYATGTRSVRGIEAVLTGFPPTASRSVVKLSRSQRDFFTLASFLRDAGYDTSFLYGGEAQFDNMRRFFMGNGFDTVVDEKDFVNPVFFGTWGASDEDLMNLAHERFTEQAAADDKPFFSLVFSSSNHTPFDFPDGRIELYDAEKHTVNNAVKYADYAIGEFFRQARASNYWDDTLFLVVADHNSRVYGSDLVPIQRFHIPGVIIGSDIKPEHDPRITSQIDLAPTLLSLMGLSGAHPMPGRDLTRLAPEVPGRAMMQFNQLHAWLEGDDAVVLQRGVAPRGFQVANGRLAAEQPAQAGLVDKATAHVTWAIDAYLNGRYPARPPTGLAHDTRAISDEQVEVPASNVEHGG